MTPARSGVATVEAPAPALRPPDDELVFDFGPDFTEPPRRAEHPWSSEPVNGVKAAILRWLEEQV